MSPLGALDRGRRWWDKSREVAPGGAGVARRKGARIVDEREVSMGRFRAPTLLAALCCAVIGVASAQGATAHGVQVSVLATFDAAHGPVAVAATNQGDVVALAGSSVVSVGPNGQQKTLTSIPGGAFGIPIGIAYDKSHQLSVALPESFGPPAAGTILTVSPNGK